MNRPTIALAIISKNEEHNLPVLLDSVQGCFDEIHVTDTGSTDRTVEIAKERGCIVHHFDWVYDFAAARDYSFSHIKTDYIAWFDCDDSLDDKESFIKWRDSIMVLSDYWLTTYNYTVDKDGKPLCSFARERVIRNNGKIHWKYFIHEGLTFDPKDQPKVQYTGAWRVKHRRTEEDLARDKGRNIQLFEKNKDKLDGRMRFYYGKEFFEHGKIFEAIEQLEAAIVDRTLEAHDRILSMQYLCYCYFKAERLDKARDLALTGLHLSPNRAELYVVIADTYIKEARFLDAIPFLNAAKSCYLADTSNQFVPIFSNTDNYGTYPRNQLARCYFQLGMHDKAKDEVDNCLKLYENEETRAIKKDLDNVSNISILTPTKSTDDIIIAGLPQGPYVWDPDVYKTKSMGGSETAAIEMAYWLNKLSGRKVKVFNNREDTKNYGDVEYLPASALQAYGKEYKPWMTINWRHNYKLTNAPTFLWCHDLITPGAEHHSNYIKHLCLTPFHKNYVQTMQGIPEDKIWVTRNGIVPERFTDVPTNKDPNKFIFSSSPDRGLDRAMLVLDEVRKKYPDIKLHVYYGIEHLPQYGHQVLFDKLKKMIAERDWVIYHGATQQDKLMSEFKSAAFCVQPSDWCETSMISALERACAGVYQIIRGIAGVVDTLKEAAESDMAKLVYSDCITPEQYTLYANEVMSAIEAEKYKKVNLDANQYSWRGVAESWLDTLPKFL